jgi:hypothetical protein
MSTFFLYRLTTAFHHFHFIHVVVYVVFKVLQNVWIIYAHLTFQNVLRSIIWWRQAFLFIKDKDLGLSP